MITLIQPQDYDKITCVASTLYRQRVQLSSHFCHICVMTTQFTSEIIEWVTKFALSDSQFGCNYQSGPQERGKSCFRVNKSAG